MPIHNWILLPTWRALVSVENTVKNHIIIPVYLAGAGIVEAVEAYIDTPIVEMCTAVTTGIFTITAGIVKSIAGLFSQYNL